MLINKSFPKRILTALACLSTIACISQTYTIQGSVTDENNTLVGYANILLLRSADSEIITGTSTDESGSFILEDIEAGNYNLQVSFIGYADYTREISLTANIDLPPIILIEEAESLSEVEIVVKRPTLERRPDRLVFNVENTSLSEGNIMDVVRRTPGVIVINDAITIKNSAPTVYINNRKVNLQTSDIIDLLEGSPASTIKSVEVITNPSARYDADSGTVLNIVMSRNLISGYNGSIYTNYTQGVFPRYNAGTSHFFKSKTVDLFLNYSYTDQKINREGEDQVFYPDDIWTSSIDRNTWSDTHVINMNLNVAMDERNRLNLSSNMLFLPFFEYLTKNRTEIIPAGPTDIGAFNSRNFSTDLKHNLGFDLDYEHIFKNNANLILNGHATFYDYSRDQRVDSDYFFGNGTFFESNAFKTRSEQKTDILTTQADYVAPLSDASTISAGAKFSNVQTESDIIQNNIINGTEVLDPNNTDAFDYDEKVYAGYLNFEHEGEKWAVVAGLRGEQSEILGRSMEQDKDNEQNYFELFPNASISFNVSEKLKLYTNYKRSIIRPNYSNLNPFRFFLNDNTIVVGNPELQPVFSDFAKIGALVNRKFTFEFYYKESVDNIFEFPVQDNVNNTVTYTPINIDLTTELGFDFITYIDVFDNWGLYFVTSFYYLKDEGSFNDIKVDRDIWTNYSILNNNFSFLKDRSLNIDLNIIYAGKNIQGLQEVDGRVISNLSIKKTMFKGKGIASLSVTDLFNEQDFFIRTKFLDQNNTAFMNLDNRYVRLGFRYKFGNTKLEAAEADLDTKERERLDERN